MVRGAVPWLMFVLVAAGRLSAAAQEPEILVEVGADRIYEGQSVTYQVTLNHVEDPSPPELKGFDDFEVTSLGQRSLDSRQVTIINGRVSQIIRRGRQYNYRLTPLKTGLLTIPGPVAKVDGRVLKGPEKRLLVRAAEEQDVVFLRITSDHQSVYPMQPFAVTLTVEIKELPEPYSAESPVAVQRRLPPALRIPWVVDDDLPDGLEPEVDWQSWLGPMQNRMAEGFSINNLGRSSVFSLFENRPMTFEPRVRKIVRRDEGGKEVGYWQYLFPRTFVARKVGRYGFGPATLEGLFATSVDARRELVGEKIFAVAGRIEVNVKDVPLEGRPDTYTGAVGQFRLSGDLNPKRAKVGDPMTLTLVLTGKGTLESVSAPDLGRVAAIAKRFKVYEATEQIKGDSCRFSYSLRPREEGIKEFPPVALSYFDVQAERYVTLQTDPIPITVTEASRLSDDQIVSTPRRFSPGGQELEARREGIFANETDPTAVRDESIRPARWAAGLAGMLGLYLVVAVVTVRLQRLTSDKALLRRRGAAANARRKLRQARAELNARRIPQGTELLEAALVGLVADAADLPEAGLTPKDVCGQLRAWGVEEDLVGRVDGFLESCDAGRYGAARRSLGGMLREAEALLHDLIRSLNAKRRFR